MFGLWRQRKESVCQPWAANPSVEVAQKEALKASMKSSSERLTVREVFDRFAVAVVVLGRMGLTLAPRLGGVHHHVSAWVAAQKTPSKDTSSVLDEGAGIGVGRWRGTR